MSYPPSSYKTWTAGEVLTAADLNNSFTTVNASNIPEDIDDYSANSTEMRVTTDPYPAATESLPTSLSGEVERLRYIVKQITGKGQWYIDAAAIGSKGADVASANALTLGTDGNFFDITGTTAITSIGTLGVGSRIALQFDGAVVVTHHSTDLILPYAANITTKAGDVLEFVEYATGDWICVGFNRGGAVVQTVYAQSVAATNGSTVIPEDDTIPQNTEGIEALTCTITPTSATNKLNFQITVPCSSSAAATMTVALFQDTNANALAVGFARMAAGTGTTINLTYQMAAGTTSATTFKIRFGGSNAGTFYINSGSAGGREYGGVCATSITITETRG